MGTKRVARPRAPRYVGTLTLEEVASGDYWITKDGRALPVNALSRKHLEAIARWFMKKRLKNMAVVQKPRDQYSFAFSDDDALTEAMDQQMDYGDK